MIVKIPGAEASGSPARTPLQVAFDEDACAALATPEANLRGHTMAGDGLVGELRIRPLTATGTVTEDKPFYVRLAVGEDGPNYDCTCEEGAAGLCCDHAVAVALVATGTINPAPGGHDPDHLDLDDDEFDEDEGAFGAEPYDLRSLLSGMTRDQLVDLVLDIADTDRALVDDLLMTRTGPREH